ncbi:MAG: GNAT family N-acetyltransferase, partial [Myxococcales bacterium]|nr:GNAT family N-acetyltransferase [Myxococcales bacterium]
ESLTARFSHIDHLRDIPEYYLHLPATWPEFKATLGRNIKESLRRCYNAPKRDGIVPRLEVVSARADVPRVLDDFFRLHRARASCEDTIHHNDVFESPAAKAFLLDVCQRFAARGAFRMFRLLVGERVVANRIGLVLGDSLYLYYSGFEPAFGRYSVMTTVVAEAIQYAIANRLRMVHLSTGHDVSKMRWGPLERRHREWLVVSPSLRGWVAHHLAQQARSLLDRTRLAGWFTRRAGRRPGAAGDTDADTSLIS